MPKAVKTLNTVVPAQSPPLWKGPYEDGITQSLLSKFLVCRERFRLLVVKGLREREVFSHKLEYGQMWHTCEETHAAGKNWKSALQKHCNELVKKWPESGEEIDHWYRVCSAQFPVYVKHYSHGVKASKRKPLYQEVAFSVPYKLPTGRTVTLRGKLDSAHFEGIRSKFVYLQENKSKGDIQQERLIDEIGSNLQTMIYLIALKELMKTNGVKAKLCGVYYNVVRRPLSDWHGKFNIIQRKGRKTKKGIVGAETKDQYYKRLGKLIEDNAEHFFFRLKVEVQESDIRKFQEECLNPILVTLCEWWDWIVANPNDPFGSCQNPYSAGVHYRSPFGVYNALHEGMRGDYYDYLATGSTRKLEKVETLFRELTPEK